MAEFFDNPEQLIEKAKNSKTFKMVSYAVGAIAVLVLAWFLYQQFVFKPANEKSKTAYWRAMVYLENDEPDNALAEFERVAKKYDGKVGGEISQYMAGRLYMDKGEFKKALKLLEKAKLKDLYLGTMVIGLQGDCHSELGDFKKAVKLYEKAAKRKANEFTTPMYLMKAALIHEMKLNNFEDAVEIYKSIEMDYYEYFKTNNVEKYLERVANKVK
jgi:predicted negative regulator of RcsB-dependent stress response